MNPYLSVSRDEGCEHNVRVLNALDPVKGCHQKENIADKRVFEKAIEHLKRNDAKLGELIARHGPLEFKTSGGMFDSLVESIIGQQLAGSAANAIIARLRSLYESHELEPKTLRRTREKTLRRAGVSPQKIRYLKDLASRVATGKLDLESLRSKPDPEIINALDQVLGIGPWTVHMLLIFTLGRPDVLPVDDFGIRKSVQALYSLEELPKASEIESIAERWHPYCSVASLYLWKDKDTIQPIIRKRANS